MTNFLQNVKYDNLYPKIFQIKLTYVNFNFIIIIIINIIITNF